MWRFIIGTVHHILSGCKITGSHSGTAWRQRHCHLQNTGTTKQCHIQEHLIFYQHNARIKDDSVNSACHTLSKSGQKTQYRTQSLHSNTQINKYPKKRIQTRWTKRPAVAMEKKLASPWCKTRTSVHYIQWHSVYSRTKSIQDANNHHHPFIFHLSVHRNNLRVWK